MRTLRGTTALLLVSLFLLSANEVAADVTVTPPPKESAGGGGNSFFSLVEQGAVSFNNGGYSGPREVCSWDRNPTGSFGTHYEDEDTFLVYGRYDCTTLADAIVLVPLGTPEQTVLPSLRSYIERQIAPPEPKITPLRPQGWVLTQVAIDFRTSSDSWQPIEATAQIDAGPNSVWVTAVARPYRLEFTPADPRYPGETVSCTDDEAVASYDWENPGACSYTYRNSSATAPNGSEFDASFATHWETTFRTSSGSTGTINLDATVTPRPLAVAEVKAFTTCVGSSC